MDNIGKKKNVKLCPDCNDVKDLISCFYQVSKNGYTKRCKHCHNKNRQNYRIKPQPYTYIKKRTGFNRLPNKLQDMIRYDIYVKLNLKTIYEKYKDEYPILKYQTLTRWNREGRIKPYDSNVVN